MSRKNTARLLAGAALMLGVFAGVNAATAN